MGACEAACVYIFVPVVCLLVRACICVCNYFYFNILLWKKVFLSDKYIKKNYRGGNILKTTERESTLPSVKYTFSNKWNIFLTYAPLIVSN